MTVVVAGATGNVGAAAVRRLVELAELGEPVGKIRALTRDPASEKAAALKDLPHVEVVKCDLMDKASVAEACAGVKAAILTCANSKEQVEQEKNFIDCVKSVGCMKLVKLGTVGLYTSLDSASEYARNHAEIESHLEDTAGDMKWTVLRPNWFMSNHLADIFGTLPLGIIAYPAEPEAKFGAIDPRDVGDLAAAMVLVEDWSPALHGRKLDLSGPEAVSMSALAALYTEALARPIKAVCCPKADWIAGAVQGGLPDWLAEAASNNFPYINEGKMAFPSSPEVLALVAPKRSMADWVKEWAPRSPPPATPADQ